MQHFQLIKPSSSSDEHSKTFVYSFAAQTPQASSDENIYIILTIWSPPPDLEQIARHIEEVFSSTFYEESDQDSAKLRYKKSIQAVNNGLADLNSYYERLEARFHLEGLIAVISKENLVISSCGDVSAYQKDPSQTTALIDKPKFQSLHNQFGSLYSCKVARLDKILLLSARFSDHIPKKVVYSLLQPEAALSYSEFDSTVKSLNNNHLGAIWIEQSPKLEESTESPILVSTLGSDNQQSFSKLEKTTTSISFTVANAMAVVKKSIKNKLASITSPNFIDSSKKIFKKMWNNLWIKYINPRPALFISGLAMLVLITIFIVAYLNWYNPQAQNLKKTYFSFEQGIEKAKSQLASQQNTEALQTLSEISSSINQLPAKDLKSLEAILAQSKKPSLEQLRLSILSLEDKIAGITRIDPIDVYQSPVAGTNYNLLTKLEETIYALDNSSGSVLSLKSGNAKIIATETVLKNSLGLTASLASNSIYALTTDSVYQIRPSGTVTKPSSASEWPSSESISSYLNNIYLLSTQDSQIYRYTKTPTGFSSKIAYLKEPSTGLLAGSVSTSVNGNIFVAKRNGDILLFDKGLQKEFSVINKPLDQIDINSIVYLDSPERLVLLNPAKKAFIVLSLNEAGAEYSKEIIVNTTSDVSSFNYSPEDKSVYFTTANSIKKFELK